MKVDLLPFLPDDFLIKPGPEHGSGCERNCD